MKISHREWWALNEATIGALWKSVHASRFDLKTLKDRGEFGWFKVQAISRKRKSEWVLVYLDRGRFASIEGLPSMIFESGECWWYEPYGEGQRLHRQEGPCMVDEQGQERYCIHGDEVRHGGGFESDGL